MEINDVRIDGGKSFDWGRTSADYAKYRDIYPREFYDKILESGLCVGGQQVLDIGTGTGVLPRNMYSLGAKWIGTDVSAEQIDQAKRLSDGTDISYFVSPAETLDFPDRTFDVITACQCYWYFKHEITAPLFARMLKDDGHLVFLSMDWLPFEDKIAGASEELVLKYSPNWSGAGETVHELKIPEPYLRCFNVVRSEAYRLPVHFTREGWNGRMKSCRGIGASLSPAEIAKWETEHMEMLKKIAPPEFDVMHFAAIAVLKKKTEEE